MPLHYLDNFTNTEPNQNPRYYLQTYIYYLYRKSKYLQYYFFFLLPILLATLS